MELNPRLSFESFFHIKGTITATLIGGDRSHHRRYKKLTPPSFLVEKEGRGALWIGGGDECIKMHSSSIASSSDEEEAAKAILGGYPPVEEMDGWEIYLPNCPSSSWKEFFQGLEEFQFIERNFGGCHGEEIWAFEKSSFLPTLVGWRQLSYRYRLRFT